MTSVLVANKNPSESKRIREALEKDYEVVAVESEKELLVVNLANLIVKGMGYSLFEEEDLSVEEAASKRLLKIRSENINHVQNKVRNLMEETKEYLGVAAKV